MPRVDRRNSTRYWNDPSLPGLSLMCADFTTQEYAPHSHEALVVAVTEQGGSEIRSRGCVERAAPSAVFVFNPAEPHSGRMGWSSHWRYRSLYLAQPALDRLADSLGLPTLPYFTRNDFSDPPLIAGLLALHQALEEGRDAFREEELLVGSFGRLFRRHASGGRPPPAAPRDRVLLGRVVAVMWERYDERLQLAELASAVSLTPFQLIGLFKRCVGLTPHAYLTQVRLNAACRLLRRGVAPAEVAAAAGFYDQSALSRHFKRSYALTPRQFARAAADRQFSPIPLPRRAAE